MGFLLVFGILAGKGNTFGANFPFFSSYKRCITPRHAPMPLAYIALTNVQYMHAMLV